MYHGGCSHFKFMKSLNPLFHFSTRVFYIIFFFKPLTPHFLSSLSADDIALCYYEKTEIMRDLIKKKSPVKYLLLISLPHVQSSRMNYFAPIYNSSSYCALYPTLSCSRTWLEHSPFSPRSSTTLCSSISANV